MAEGDSRALRCGISTRKVIGASRPRFPPALQSQELLGAIPERLCCSEESIRSTRNGVRPFRSHFGRIFPGNQSRSVKSGRIPQNDHGAAARPQPSTEPHTRAHREKTPPGVT